MSAPFIPELSLGTVETGGGWGVGEQFARLPPASVQAESRVPVYTVAPERNTTNSNNNNNDSDEDSCAQEEPALADKAEMDMLPTTHYRRISGGDDDTFIDHGSASHPIAPVNDSIIAEDTRASNGVSNTQGHRCPNVDMNETTSLDVKSLRPVSRMMAELPVRAMVAGPDGASLWVAFGDDPVTMLDFKGTELNINRTVDVTQVYAMAIVRVPAAKAVTFKPPARVLHHSSHAVGGSKSRGKEEEEEGDTYVLWCGITRGSIAIVDLTNFSVAGAIKGAHAQTISGLWYISTGKVWTAGCDKALRVWDPQTRRRIKSRNIATIISDLCYVPSCKQVWAISDDPYIRVFDASGNNVRLAKQSPDKPENSLRMRSEMCFIKYFEPANLVYVSLARGLAAIDPVTCEIPITINATISSLTFMGNTAVVIGHGEFMQWSKDCVAVIDLSDPQVPSLLFRGVAVGTGLTSIRMQVLPSVPFAVAAQEMKKSDRFLSVFNYEGSKAFCRSRNNVFIQQHQRKIIVENPNVVSRRPVITVQQGGEHVSSPGLSQPHPVVFAKDKRGVLVREENNTSNVVLPHRSAVFLSRYDGNMSSGYAQTSSPSFPSTSQITNRNVLPNTTSTSVINNAYHHSSSNGNNKNNNIGSPFHPATTSTSISNHPDMHYDPKRIGVNNGGVEKNIAVEVTTPPELMVSLTRIEKQTEDLKSLFAQINAPRPALDDFSKLHTLVSRMAINNQLGHNLDAEEMEDIEKGYQTLEGRVIAASVERLRKNTLYPHSLSTIGSTRLRESVGRQDAPSTPGGGRGTTTMPPLVLDKNPNNVTDIIASNRAVDDGASVGGSEISSESLLRWVAQITRSGKGERDSHRRQLESLQRHNTRIVERNAALINGLTRMEQALCTYAQRLLEDADVAVVMSSDTNCDSPGHVYIQRHIQLLNQSLQQIEPISVSSSPKEITEAIGSLVTLTSRLLSAQQVIHGDDTVRRTHYDSPSVRTNNDQLLDTARAMIQNGSTLLTTRSHSPRPTVTAVLSMRPQRMRAIIEDQITSIESFVKDIGKFWCCLEETQKVIYLPYEGGEKPDLFEDFMQFAVLWHLREAQVMVDVSRRESVIVMAEALLSDIESKESVANNNDMMGSIHSNNTAVALPDKASLIRNEKNPNGTKGNRTTTAASGTAAATTVTTAKSGVAGTITSDSERLVGISLELESVASRIRESLKKAERNLPKGVSKESVGGFFLIPNEKFHVDATKLRGMLYWERVSMHLLYECLESLEELVFHSNEQPRVFRKDNFKALEQQVVDWRTFLEDIHGESTQLCSAIFSSRQDASTSRVSTTMNESSLTFNRSSSINSRDVTRNGDGDAVNTERSSQWVMLFGLYVQYTERTDAKPTLFASNDASDIVTVDDFGLMPLLDEVAEIIETVRAKSAALLRYCQKVQGRIARILEDVVVNEETGQIFIPASPGGPIAERYCKGFCHDLN